MDITCTASDGEIAAHSSHETDDTPCVRCDASDSEGNVGLKRSHFQFKYWALATIHKMNRLGSDTDTNFICSAIHDVIWYKASRHTQ